VTAPNGLDHDTLRAIAERFPPYRVEGKGYRCRCPVHDDHEPEPGRHMGDKGVPVVNCRAGCDQGQVWAAVRPPRQPKPAARRIVAVYPYPDEQGVVLYEVVRFDPKDFRQRLPDGTWKLGTTRRVLYRLPEIVAADEVVVVEGEKAADRLAALGVAATCSPGGAGKWRKAYAPR
jgi:putative DNA primase/helicase